MTKPIPIDSSHELSFLTIDTSDVQIYSVWSPKGLEEELNKFLLDRVENFSGSITLKLVETTRTEKLI